MAVFGEEGFGGERGEEGWVFVAGSARREKKGAKKRPSGGRKRKKFASFPDPCPVAWPFQSALGVPGDFVELPKKEERVCDS